MNAIKSARRFRKGRGDKATVLTSDDVNFLTENTNFSEETLKEYHEVKFKHRSKMYPYNATSAGRAKQETTIFNQSSAY